MKKKQFSLLFILIIFVNMSTTSGSTKIRNPTALRGIVDSFEPREFLPPRLLFNLGENCHYQTIFGSGVLKQAWSAFKNGEVLNGGKGTMERPFITIPHRINTDDNDFFDIEIGQSNIMSDTIVLIQHGLESNMRAPLVTNIADSCHSQGFQTLLVAFRSCNSEPNNNLRMYHLGFTADMKRVISYVNKTYPNKKIFLSGFSLGANIIFKLLGELGDSASDYNIIGAAVAW